MNTHLRKFFDIIDAEGTCLTFDDVRLRTSFSDMLPHEANPTGRLSKSIPLSMPIIASPMDTVTTSPMAIACAEMGGIGIIHKNLDPERQVKEVGRVKHRLHGRVFTPLTVRETQTVADVLAMREERQLAFRSFPVLSQDDQMLGLVSGNDFDMCSDNHMLIRDIMTPIGQTLVGPPTLTPEDAFQLMRRHKKKVLPLVADGKLVGLFVFSDLKRLLMQDSPHNLDKEGRLRVGAAVGAGDEALRRAELLAEKGCDVFHIDTAHGHHVRIRDTLGRLKKSYPSIDVIVGNVSDGDGAQYLADIGADGILCGQGPGSICTTRVVAGVGVPQVSALFECASALEGTGVPLIADGGINNSGDIVIALAIGASSVMIGRLLAGTDESPGEKEVHDGRLVKVYRGMGSAGAMRDSAQSRERYGYKEPKKTTPEGIEGYVPYKGPVKTALETLLGGIRAGMGYQGARTLDEMRTRARLFRMSAAGLAESRPHHVEFSVA